MSKVKDLELVKHEAAVLYAAFKGFYKHDPVQVGQLCTHITCGYKRVDSPLRGKYCHVMQNNDWSYNKPSLAEKKQHETAGCDTEWCVVKYHSKPKKVGLNKAKCKRDHYLKYSEADLANPDIKPEAAAVILHIAAIGDWMIHANLVALYDLSTDTWHLDSWWRMPQSNVEMLMPDDNKRIPVKPSGVAGISDVIATLKRSF